MAKTRKEKKPKITIKSLQAQIVMLQAQKEGAHKELEQTKDSRAFTAGQHIEAQSALSKILGAGTSYHYAEEKVEMYAWPEIYAKVGALKQQVDVEGLRLAGEILNKRVSELETSTFLKPACPCQARSLGYPGNGYVNPGNTCGS